MSILIKERNVAVPGDIIADGDFKAGDGSYKSGNQIIASIVGLVTIKGKFISLIPLLGPYLPRVNDYVIGKVIDANMSSWKVDIKAPYIATLSLSNAVDRSYDPTKERTTSYYQIGDTILARIYSMDRINGITLTLMDRNLGKLKRGRIIEILPAKIPRLVGRRRSMIGMIEKETNTRIEIGQNGVIWINGRTIEDELLAEKAAKLVETEAHTTGLTDRVHDMMIAEKAKRGI